METPEAQPDTFEQDFHVVRRFLVLAVAVFALLLVALLIYALWQNRFDHVLTEMVLKNFPVIIGMPFSAMMAFVVVALFRQADGPLAFEGLGFKFKGASGEIVMWNMSFLILVLSLHVLWRD